MRNNTEILTLAVALFILSSAYLTGSGRASLGLETAFGSRYSLQSIILQITIILFYYKALARVILDHGQLVISRLCLIASLLMISIASGFASSSLEEWKDRVSILDTAGFALSNGVYSDGLLELIYPKAELVRPSVQFLAQNKLGPFSPKYGKVFRPPLNLVNGIDLQKTEYCTAQFEATRTGPHWFRLEGWIFHAAKPASNGWIIVMDETAQNRTVGYGRQDIERLDVDEATHVKIGRSGFYVGLNGPELADDTNRTFTTLLIPDESSEPNCKVSIGTEPEK